MLTSSRQGGELSRADRGCLLAVVVSEEPLRAECINRWVAGDLTEQNRAAPFWRGEESLLITCLLSCLFCKWLYKSRSFSRCYGVLGQD